MRARFSICRLLLAIASPLFLLASPPCVGSMPAAFHAAGDAASKTGTWGTSGTVNARASVRAFCPCALSRTPQAAPKTRVRFRWPLA